MIMEYIGPLYARIGGKYLKISHTDDFENLEEKFKRVQSNLIDKEEVNAELRQTIIAKQNREIRLENILGPHQDLTQWIEEELTCEPNSNKFEVSHDFLEQLFYKVVQINH